MTVRILPGDCRDVLATLPDESVHCVVTSPPYWGLRDYGTAIWEGGDPNCSHSVGPTAEHEKNRQRAIDKGYEGHGGWEGRAFRGDGKRECLCGARRIDTQLGLEQSLGEHVEAMTSVFREVRRVLRRDGTLWMNYGDSYATSVNGRSAADTKAVGNDDRTFRDKPFSTVGNGLKPKDLCGAPWRVAFALQADGWYLRQDIIWSKPNPMPESVRDRCTKAHEYLFLLSKSERYYYDQEGIREEAEYGRGTDPTGRMFNRIGSATKDAERIKGGKGHTFDGGRNKRSVWEIATAPFSEAHFATFPPALIEPCIKAGTSEKGCCSACGAPWVRKQERGAAVPLTTSDAGRKATWTIGDADRDPSTRIDTPLPRHYRPVLGESWLPSCPCDGAVVPCTVFDPFGGAGTTGLVADRLQRNAILIELNPEYAAMADRRIRQDAGLFHEAAE